MIPLPLPDRRIMQVCWLVPDLHAGMETWTRATGVGPWFHFENVAWDNPYYRGKPWDPFPVKAAIAQAGEIQVELIENSEPRPSMFTDVIPAGKGGFHHVGICSDNYEQDLAFYTNQGFEVAFSGVMMGYPVCWIDTVSTLGYLVELLTANPVADKIFAQFRSAAENWDGKNPIRTLS